MNIGLLGCGVVGGGIMDFCAERTDLHVTKVLVRRERPELGDRAVTDIGAITGDAVFSEVEPIVGAITPVPGGVGSVTTSVLIGHVVEAAERTL